MRKFTFNSPWQRQTRTQIVVLQKINGSINDVIDPPAELRPRGWFFMFPQHTYPTIVCPECGEISDLSDHKIDHNGMVRPSLVCPNEKKCKWHVFARLENWQAPIDQRLSETLLRSMIESNDPLKSKMAYEILDLRSKQDKNKNLKFKDFIVFACIGKNLGNEIAATLKIPIKEVKSWALGYSMPHPDDIDNVIRVVNLLIRRDSDKRQ